MKNKQIKSGERYVCSPAPGMRESMTHCARRLLPGTKYGVATVVPTRKWGRGSSPGVAR